MTEIGMISKFEYYKFCSKFDRLAVSKEKYTKKQAIEIAKRELTYKYKYLAIGNAFVRMHIYGVNEDGEPLSCWWLEYHEHESSCPCWVFHLTNNTDVKGYEYIKLGDDK